MIAMFVWVYSVYYFDLATPVSSKNGALVTTVPGLYYLGWGFALLACAWPLQVCIHHQIF